MELQRLAGDFAICRIGSIGDVDFTREYIFLAITPDEISLVCESDSVPQNTIAHEPGWKALKVCGVLDFALIGIIAKISGILAAVQISLFAISTYNTDYILIKSENFDRGIRELVNNGYSIA